MRLLGWLLIIVLAPLAIAFAVANRGTVSISFDPFPLALDLPLYLAVFAALALGMMIGGVASRIALWRKRARDKATVQAAETPHRADPPPAGAVLPPPVV